MDYTLSLLTNTVDIFPIVLVDGIVTEEKRLQFLDMSTAPNLDLADRTQAAQFLNQSPSTNKCKVQIESVNLYHKIVFNLSGFPYAIQFLE